VSHLSACRERAFAAIERKRAEVQRACASIGGPYESLHAQAAFVHDRVAALHEQVATLHDRVAKLVPDNDSTRELKQKQAQWRLLGALRSDFEHPVEAGQFEDSRDGRRDIFEAERLLVRVSELEEETNPGTIDELQTCEIEHDAVAHIRDLSHRVGVRDGRR
jgi:hypothetical protein